MLPTGGAPPTAPFAHVLITPQFLSPKTWALAKRIMLWECSLYPQEQKSAIECPKLRHKQK